MAESQKIKERTKSAKDIFDQARRLGQRLFNRSAQDRLSAVADRYVANIRNYLGENYNINTQVPVSVYMGRRNNRYQL